jgi:hypothetical protein
MASRVLATGYPKRRDRFLDERDKIRRGELSRSVDCKGTKSPAELTNNW